MKRRQLLSKKELFFDFLFYTAGCFIYSFAVTAFITPNKISPGGFTGIATAINYLSGFPVGVLLLLLNVPVIILGIVRLGGIFIVKTAVATGILSITLELSDLLLAHFFVDKILACIFGGILMGTGLSLILLRGATTGGVDIIATLVNRRFRYITVGKIILISDIIVISLASAVYGNIESGLYSIVAMYASSRVTDAVLYGSDKGKIIYAVTDRPAEICKNVAEKLRRGITRMSVVGGYTQQEHTLLFCTVRINEVSAVCRIIKECDMRAFITVSDAGEILGEGFKENDF